MAVVRIISDGTASGTRVMAGDQDITEVVESIEFTKVERGSPVSAQIKLTRVDLGHPDKGDPQGD